MKNKNIILGTAQFGLDYGISNYKGEVSIEEIEKILNLAKSEEIKYIDTAVVYGNSETKLGLIGIKEFKVITKIPKIENNKKKNIKQHILSLLEQSIKRLKISKIYCLLIHDTKSIIDHNQCDVIEALEDLRDMGIIENYGFSIYDEYELEFILKRYNPNIIQVPANIFDQRFLSVKLLDRINKKGIILYARSIFLQGLLLMNDIERPKFFEEWKSIFLQWDLFLTKNNLTKFQGAIYFINQCNNIQNVIIGIESEIHLKKIIKEIDKKTNINFPKFDIINKDIINPRVWR